MTFPRFDCNSLTCCLPLHIIKQSNLSVNIRNQSWDSVFLPGSYGKTLGDFLSITDLANGQAVSLGADHLHLDPIHQTLQLVPDVPGSSHGAELDEVLIAPLCGVTALHPLREKDIKTAVSITPGFKVGISQGYWVLTGHGCETVFLNLWVYICITYICITGMEKNTFLLLVTYVNYWMDWDWDGFDTLWCP